MKYPVKRKRFLKLTGKAMAVFLALAMILGFMPLTHTPAYAEDGTGKTITGLGTGAITNPTKGNWDKVYFGSQSDPIKFNVLQINETHFGGNTMLLDCEGSVSTQAFGTNIRWADSSIRSWLNGGFLESRFTGPERSAIARSTKTEKADNDGDNYPDADKSPFVSLNGEQIFLLDVVEARNTSYGFDSTNGESDTRVKDFDTYNDIGRSWWLRSLCKYYSLNHGNVEQALYVDPYGEISQFSPNKKNVSPALNVDTSSILFTSATSDGAYKLTIVDPEMKVEAATAVRGTDTMSFEYALSGDNKDDINRVSVVMTNGTWDADKGGWSDGAELKFYGALTGGTDGSGNVALPPNYNNDWNIYLIAEQVNEGNRTDYAGEPVKIKTKLYTIAVDTNVNHATISVDKENAAVGETVTVTVKTEGAYSPSRVIAKATDSYPGVRFIDVRGHDGVFTGTFDMPDYPVIVTAVIVGAGDDSDVSSTVSSVADPVVGAICNVNDSSYAVTGASTVSLVKASAKKSFTIPAAVDINGKIFEVTGIQPKAFKGTKVKTLTIKTKKLTKKSVKNSLKGSIIETVKVKVGKKKDNRKYVKKYRKIFTKKNAGRKARVR